jgi:hypothetical protein
MNLDEVDMSNILCNAPFCQNSRNLNHAWCPEHRWDREKRKIKPYKELLPYWIIKRCDIHGLLTSHQVTINKKGSTYCRACVNDKHDPIKQKKYHGKYKSRTTQWRLKKRYSICSNDFDLLMIKQNNCCAICKIHISEHKERKGDKQFAVDHCHTTNKIRGLLCYRCNMGLGYFQDNPELTQSATIYLCTN